MCELHPCGSAVSFCEDRSEPSESIRGGICNGFRFVKLKVAKQANKHTQRYTQYSLFVGPDVPAGGRGL